MNPLHLRPKNLVNYKGNVIEIVSVSNMTSDGTIGLDNEGNSIYVSTNDLQPIEFTSEWKTKLSFDNRVINGFFVDKSEYGGYGFFVITDIESEPIGKFELCKINGVHHAQNLFLELTRHQCK